MRSSYPSLNFADRPWPGKDCREEQGKRSVDAEAAAPGANGTGWTAEQVAIVVANYFLMLDRERAGDKINKADLYRKLAPEVRRSEKSIEWKLRNVSAVLEEIGIAWIPGLLPAHNYQDSLVEAVEAQLGQHPKVLIDPVSVKPRFTSAGGPVLVPPLAFLNSDPQDNQPALRQLVGRYDPAARDELMRSFQLSQSSLSAVPDQDHAFDPCLGGLRSENRRHRCGCSGCTRPEARAGRSGKPCGTGPGGRPVLRRRWRPSIRAASARQDRPWAIGGRLCRPQRWQPSFPSVLDSAFANSLVCQKPLPARTYREHKSRVRTIASRIEGDRIGIHKNSNALLRIYQLVIYDP